MKLHKLAKKRYDEGGVIQNGFFAPLNFKTIKPEFVSQLGGLEHYLKEAKESENNRLKAFNDMKTAQALDADKNSAFNLHKSYSDALDKASTELKNPFALTKYTQKQAIDYVNNPLRKNIEESSKNLEESRKKLNLTPNADQRSSNAFEAITTLEHEKSGGTKETSNSIYKGFAPVLAEHPAEALAKVVPALRHLDKKQWSSLSGDERTQLEGVGVTEKGWTESTNDTKLQALARMALGQNTNLIRSVQGNAFQDIYDANVAKLGDRGAKEKAYNEYQNKANKTLQKLEMDAVTMLRQNNTGSDKNPFNYAKPTTPENGDPYNANRLPVVQPSGSFTPDEEFRNQGVDLSNVEISDKTKTHKVLGNAFNQVVGKYNIPDATINFDRKGLKTTSKDFATSVAGRAFTKASLIQKYKMSDKEADAYINGISAQESSLQRAEDIMVKDYGMNPTLFRTDKDIVDNWKRIENKRSEITLQYYQPTKAVMEEMTGFVVPTLLNQHISLDNQPLKPFKEVVDKSDLKSGNLINPKNYQYRGISFMPDVKNKTVKPVYDLVYADPDDEQNKGKAYNVKASTSLTAQTLLKPITDLEKQRIFPDRNAEKHPVVLPYGNGFVKVFYKYLDGEPVLYNAETEKPLHTGIVAEVSQELQNVLSNNTSEIYMANHKDIYKK